MKDKIIEGLDKFTNVGWNSKEGEIIELNRTKFLEYIDSLNK